MSTLPQGSPEPEVNESISLQLISGAFSEGTSVLITPGSFCYQWKEKVL